MPRPIRIEYRNAFYHVMNRGKGKQNIFHGKRYFLAFLLCLEEASEQFDAMIHSYCLMHNHYHLLIQTPRANLSRIMRHINSIYTQRYNRLRKTDGPLFRGRYKSILINESAYFLQLTRYIHRNPIETRRALVDRLEDYPWSSYPAYIDKATAPSWLFLQKAYEMINHQDPIKAYKKYTEQESDEEIIEFFSKRATPSILGDIEFRQSLVRRNLTQETQKEKVRRCSLPDTDTIILAVAETLAVDPKSITAPTSARHVRNFPRKLAIYCCQRYGDIPQTEIAEIFNLGSRGYVSKVVHEMKNRIGNDSFDNMISSLEETLIVH